MKKFLTLLSTLMILMAALQPLGAGRHAAAQTIEATTAGPAWYDPAWHYRRPVTVSNSGAAIGTPYQVLVTLDSSNFDFSKADVDLNDLRVTTGDGTTVLPFWLEQPFSSPPAYVWVKLPSVPTTDTTIYLYFGNSSATSASDGIATFDLFDDRWCQYSGSNCGGNPVLSAGQAWWESTVSYPMVFEDTSAPDGYRYHMFYDGHNVIGHAKGYAYSNTLNIWTEYDGGRPNPNPIMGTGYAGNAAFAWGDAIKIGSTYYIFPSRGPGTTVLASSTDLVTWTGFLSLTLNNDSGGNIGTGAAILKEGDGITPIVVDNKYWMVYFHGGSPGSMYLASSPFGGDLRTWTSTGSAILAPGGWDSLGLWTPSFARFGNYYYIYYQGNGAGGWDTGFARADAYSGGNPIIPPSNPASWYRPVNPVITNGPGGSWDSTYVIDPMVRYFEGVYYVFYTGDVANGYATAPTPEGPWTKYGPSNSVWTTAAGTPSVSGGILTLQPGVGIKSLVSTFINQATGYRAYYIDGDNSQWGGFINGTGCPCSMVEAYNLPPKAVYLRNYYDGSNNGNVALTGVVRDTYHIFEVQWQYPNPISNTYIDHSSYVTASNSSHIPRSALPITIYSFANGTTRTNLQVDWVYVRQFRSPEPTTLVPDLGSRDNDIQETVAVTGPGALSFTWINVDTPGLFIATVDSQGTLSSVQVVRYPIDHPYATICPPEYNTECTQTLKYWEIHATGTGYSVSLTLPWASGDNSKDKVCFWTGSGQVWDCAMTSYDGNTVTRSGVSDLSDWAVGDNVGPTAITLETFSVSSSRYWTLPALVGSGLLGCVLALGWLASRKR